MFFLQVNIIVFALILYGLRSQIGNLNTDLSKLKDNRLLTFKAISHFFIMGCSWILGFFQTIRFFSYAFVIVNSLQGPFIFLVHCVLNKQVIIKSYNQLCKGLDHMTVFFFLNRIAQ
ncbi:AGRE1 protein, partial [Amia calva]|nr:AGRE1 protein [Amia calva]